MLRKIRYSEGRRIRGGEEEREKTRRYRRRKAGGAPAKERKRDNVRALSRRAFLTSVSCLL
jgi:hypothetical protein